MSAQHQPTHANAGWKRNNADSATVPSKRERLLSQLAATEAYISNLRQKTWSRLRSGALATVRGTIDRALHGGSAIND